MPLDDSTWVIHSLPRDPPDAPAPEAEAIRHAFRSVLSPWRKGERSQPCVRMDGRDVEGRSGSGRAAG